MLAGVRVLDVGQGVSGPYCARLLAGLGAEVVKVEPPSGDLSRGMGPFPGDAPHPERSGLFLALNAGKHGVTLDMTSSSGRGEFLRLVAGADIVVEDRSTGGPEEQYPGYQALRRARPEIILTSITPFGGWGPYAGYKATDLVLFHITGHAHGLLGPVQNPATEPPVRAGGHQAEMVAGLAAATASLTALYRRDRLGLGCHVTVSSFEAMVTQLVSGLANCAYGKPPPPRGLKDQKEAAVGGMVSAIGGVLPCTDGYVAISPREEAQWRRWLELMGNPEWASDERFATREARQANSLELWTLLGQWSRSYSKGEIARWGQERRIPCFPVNTVEDLLSDRHLEERRFFVEITHPAAGPLRYPGLPFKSSAETLPPRMRPAPLLGEHNETMGTFGPRGPNENTGSAEGRAPLPGV